LRKTYAACRHAAPQYRAGVPLAGAVKRRLQRAHFCVFFITDETIDEKPADVNRRSQSAIELNTA
jgi:hypothetical protein